MVSNVNPHPYIPELDADRFADLEVGAAVQTATTPGLESAWLQRFKPKDGKTCFQIETWFLSLGLKAPGFKGSNLKMGILAFNLKPGF